MTLIRLRGNKMLINHITIKLVLLIALMNSFTNSTEAEENKETTALSADVFQVHKRTQCGCCNEWISHIEENGIQTETHNLDDLNPVKNKYGIEPKLQSCHTSISKDGYIFEGHIPAKFIKQFLTEKPDGAIGLAVPSMPVGSPGMEYKNMFRPYFIYVLKIDGSREKYAKVETAQEQF